MRKIEIRLFLDPPSVRRIDRLIREGYASSRSEAIRRILGEFWGIRNDLQEIERMVNRHEKRLRNLEKRLNEKE